jgi:hypothetical protein
METASPMGGLEKKSLMCIEIGSLFSRTQRTEKRKSFPPYQQEYQEVQVDRQTSWSADIRDSKGIQGTEPILDAHRSARCHVANTRRWSQKAFVVVARGPVGQVTREYFPPLGAGRVRRCMYSNGMW